MDIDLVNFSSLFELIVAFSFAYGGIESFQNYVNSLVYNDFGLELSLGQKKLFTYRDEIYSVPERESFAETKLRETSVASIKKLVENFADFSSNFERIKTGKIFSCQFNITGFYYLLVLIIAGFQKALGNEATFAILVLTTLICLFFIFGIIWNINKVCGNYESKVLQFRILRKVLFFIFYFIIIVSLVLIFKSLLSDWSQYLTSKYVIFYYGQLFAVVLTSFPILILGVNFYCSKVLYRDRLKKSLQNLIDSSHFNELKSYYEDLTKKIDIENFQFTFFESEKENINLEPLN